MENNKEFFHPPILRNQNLNEQLFKEGFAHFPLLNQTAVEQLKSLFFEYHTVDEVSGLYVSSTRKSREIMNKINDVNCSIFKEPLEQHFKHVKKLGGTFIVKNPDPQYILHPHQDWSIVDETLFRSFTIWVPLQDITEENGAMYVLPGSHNWIRGYRHITIDSVYGKIYDLTWKHMIPIYMKAGEALVFDHALVHASKPNCGNQPRICATHGLISEGAEMRVYLNNKGSIEEYACHGEYYLEPSALTGPHPFPLLRVVDFKPTQFSENDFYAYSKMQKPHLKNSWWKQLNHIFARNEKMVRKVSP